MTWVLQQGRSGLLLAMFASTALRVQGDPVSANVGLDHIILSAPTLTSGIAAFRRLTGVPPQRGGQHPGRGTENALVSLGPGHYLEILAPLVAPTGTSAGATADTTTLQLDGWAVHTHTLDQLLRRVRAAGFPTAEPSPGSRRTPDNTLLAWRTAAATGPGLDLAPFFIEWGAGTAHPSTTSPGGCRLASWTVIAPDITRLSAFFKAAGYTPALRIGKAPGLQLVLDCPSGRVSFSS